ncbi:MAG: hypothetical protein US58_C0007G0002 [Candidatus Magasanikbacteria bacterium GW2011_GWA2_37_8]|uniref:Uncharacterized protein n=1 Tax=Candidatus Magasanikbacteria bacterium GW2011_GWA2_37_8 TaxID=1619036 RepID=A0A0G0KK62_9BACT|nr:MAG: hypothetical protein US58_C0007G0002 [Candidatus Magasanikbacteria bacterium GW2011_GWA2_37_8]
MHDRIAYSPQSSIGNCDINRDRCEADNLDDKISEEKTDPVNLEVDRRKIKAECRKKEANFKKDYLDKHKLAGGPYTPFDCVQAYLNYDDARIAHFTTKEKLEYESVLCALHVEYEKLKALYPQK